jgi:hypothetical protein
MTTKKPAKTAKTLTGARGRVAAAKAPSARAKAKAQAHADVIAEQMAPQKARMAAITAKPADAPKYRGIWAEAAAAAAKGKLPPAPDFTADTHKPYRAKLATLVELAKAGDMPGLAAVVINPTSSSPKALARYRELCIVALHAKAAR